MANTLAVYESRSNTHMVLSASISLVLATRTDNKHVQTRHGVDIRLALADRLSAIKSNLHVKVLEALNDY